MAARRVKTEYIVLGVVIVGLALVIALRSGNRLRYTLPTLPVVKTDDITRLAIASQGGTVELEKREGLWRILPEGYPADSSLVQPMLGALSRIELSALVSEGESYARYQLDEAGRLRVTAWAGSTVARVVDVGKQDTGGRASFVKLENDKRVYSSLQDLRGLFGKDKAALRDMTVLSFTQGDIVEITLKRGSESLKLAKASVQSEGKTATSWKSEEGVEWDQARVDRLLTTLSRLRCDAWSDARTDVGPELLSVFLKAQDGTGYTLSVHDKSGSTYPGLSSQADYPFTIAEYKVEDISDVFTKPESPAK